VGGTATFSVTASGTPPLSYQWRFNGTNISGATNTILTLANVQLNQAGNYAVLVTNLYGSALSSNAVLTVNPSPLSSVPVIFAFSPISGIAGTIVTISGTNFSPVAASNSGTNFSPVAASNIVYFGAVRATVTTASVTNLAVMVPVGAVFAPITVTVNGLTAYANSPFLPTFPTGGTLSSASLNGPTNLTAGSGPSRVVIGDLDGDGKPDMVVSDAYDGRIYIYRNISTNGTLAAGSFASPVILTIGGGSDGMWGLAAADVDGDGRLDIVVLDETANQVMVLKNLCVPGNITTNSFAPSVNFSVGSDPRGVAVRDLNGDGKPEIVVANWGDSTVSVLRNVGTVGSITTNSFAPKVNFATGPNPQNVAIADVDGDGKPDVVSVNNNSGTSSAVSVLRNICTSVKFTFAAKVDYPGLSSSYDIAIGDLDGDGKLDLAVSSFNLGQAVSVYRNVSTPGSITTGSFASHVDFAAGGWGNSVAMGDVDGDGKPDVAVVTQLPDHLSIFKNTSTPGSFTTNSFATRIDFPSGWNPNGVAIGDLDGDGRPDIAFGNCYSATISLYRNVVPFGSPPVITTQPTNQTVVVGSAATFSVTASGTPPPSYQWSFNGTNIPGAINMTLVLTNVQFVQAGSYAVLVTNHFGSILSSNALLTAFPPPLVQNGGFELGTFDYWTTGGDFDYCSVNSEYVHSGVYGAELAAPDSPGYISQTLATTVGQVYLVSCWLYCDGTTPNEFSVTWNGTTLFDQQNIGDTSWTNLQFQVSATTTNTVLTFEFRDDWTYLGLDDITVNPMGDNSPLQFQTMTLNNDTINLHWNAQAGQLYQVQYTTNLTQIHWVNLGGVLSTPNSSIMVTDDPTASTTRFYRIVLLPAARPAQSQ
jgi:hypothetical protein